MTPLEITRRLMSIPSVTGDEGEIAEFLSSHLASTGYRVERQDVEPGRFNVLAFAGAGAKVVLCTHIDTVPPTLPIHEDDEYLYGRGACDTKGIIAAMLDAGSFTATRVLGLEVPPPDALTHPVSETSGVVASYFGPGLWENHTACGHVLSAGTGPARPPRA